jgi:hypothetical protein
MRNLVISVFAIGLLSLLPLSPRVGSSSGLLPVSISVGQDEANAYVTYRRARVTSRRSIVAPIAALTTTEEGEGGGLRWPRSAGGPPRVRALAWTTPCPHFPRAAVPATPGQHRNPTTSLESPAASSEARPRSG